MARLLVTGGAGYIGSHVVRQLCDAGHVVIVYDNLSTGSASAVDARATFQLGDVADTALLTATLQDHAIEAVLHFAAFIVVPDSVADPLSYYKNNTAGTLSLLQAMTEARVKRLVFSSTAAVYGSPSVSGLITEETPLAPMSPYGHSKRMSEQMIADCSAAYGVSAVVLRYFNVAGAESDGTNGQRSKTATHLIKVACEVATGKRDSMSVFGTDYATPDGTCVRDYIHVMDLARAHLNALDHLLKGGGNLTLNCGYGQGSSVRAVLAAVEKAAGQALNITYAPRRAGDPPSLVASSDKLRTLLNWQPQHNTLDEIVESALAWERTL